MEIHKLTDAFQLFAHYCGQTQPQNCYIELNCTNEVLTADYNPEIGTAVPMDVWHGHTRRYSIPCLVADAANDLIDEIAPLANQVIAGYSSEWDGHNWVAHYTDAAENASAEICEICQKSYHDADNIIDEWDVDEWLRDYNVDPTTTDDELVALAQEIETEAANDNIILDGDVLEWLKNKHGAKN